MNVNCYIKVHNVTISVNGIKMTVPSAIVKIHSGSGIGVILESSRKINQFLFGTNLDKLSERDVKECKSFGELGTNMVKLINDPKFFGKQLVYRSEKYKYKGRKKSYFEVYCEVAK